MILHGYDYRLSMRTGKTTYMATRAIIFKASINDIVIVCLMSTYTVETIVRSTAVRCSYAPRFEFFSGVSALSRTCFTYLLAAILEDGIKVDRRPSGFGSVELS